MLTPKSLFLALIVAFVALALPGTAEAQRPCWKDLVDDYWADFRVDNVYPIGCYRDAMEALPDDVSQYSDAQDDLRRALLDAIRDERAGNRFADPERGEDEPTAPVAEEDEPDGFFGEVLNKIGPKNADSVPVPLLVLGGIALLLFGAAGVSYAARWFQERQAQVATHPAPPDDPRP